MKPGHLVQQWVREIKIREDKFILNNLESKQQQHKLSTINHSENKHKGLLHIVSV